MIYFLFLCDIVTKIGSDGGTAIGREGESLVQIRRCPATVSHNMVSQDARR